MAEQLTPAQARAVNHRGGRLLVSAAAGSGKTKVLVDRLMGYITGENPANLDDFLMITYTKAAAMELRGKIAARLSQKIAEDPGNLHLQQQLQRLYLAAISTVHGFCGDILKHYAYRLELPVDFRVADENECMELRASVLENLLEESYSASDEAFHNLVDTQGYGRDDRNLPEIVLSLYDAARCHRDPERWLENCLAGGDVSGVSDCAETPWGQYLISNLHSFLDDAIAFFAWAAEQFPEAPKVQDNLNDTLFQLERLRSLETWQDIHDFPPVSFALLRFPKNIADTALRDMVKTLREEYKTSLKKAMQFFSDDASVVLSDAASVQLAQQSLIELVRRFGADYARKKKQLRILDFSDLEHQMLKLLYGASGSVPTAAAREIGERFREIMVDEYQDSNAVQDAIFDALTREKQNLFMVGDVKQSIYRFRLADPTIFLEKYHAYSETGGGDTKVLLSANFRSGGEVVEAVNSVFSRCMSKAVGDIDYTEAEALVEGIPHKPLPDDAVELHCIESGEDAYETEAEFVARRIAQMLQAGIPIRDGEGFRPVRSEDIVILLRSPGSVGGSYRRALENRGIPCNTGNGENLLKTAEIGTLRSILQVISNPRQDIPLLAVLASPVFGFTAEDLAQIRSIDRRLGLFDALCRSDMPKAAAFVKLLEDLREDSRIRSLTELVRHVLNVTRLDSIYGCGLDGEVRRGNLQNFYELVCSFEAASVRTLSQFLDSLDAMEEKGLPAQTAPGGVTIMSIHKSKGLEFPVVFLCALSKKFNTMDQQARILCDKELGLGLNVVDTVNRLRYPSAPRRAIAAKMAAEMVSEEMRVLYVAMTRARDRLVMTFTSKDVVSRLEKLAVHLRYNGGSRAIREAKCPGNWVLLTALQRTEAGAIRNLTGYSLPGAVSDIPWKITFTPFAEEPEVPISGSEVEAAEKLREYPGLKEALEFVYPYEAATHAPSKQTATGRKGHFRDEEAAALTVPEFFVSTRKPAFVSGAPGGKARGTAVHLCMQHIRFTRCTSESGIWEELERMTSDGFMTREEAGMVDANQILNFFTSPLGSLLSTGAACVREFKFSILDDASAYGENLEGEKVLLQGVVDCAILEPDGITVLDFKTDRVTEATLAETVRRYTPQLQTYRDAMQRIYGQKVKAAYLYFFHLNCFVQVA